MRHGIKASLLLVLLMTGVGGAAAQSSGNQAKASDMDTDVTKIKQALLGNWESIAPEVRPSVAKNADGTLKPFYLKRTFKYLPSDKFELDIINLADTHNAEGVRAYLCMDRTPDVVPSRIWVIMVPVKDGKDIIEALPDVSDGDGGTDPNTTIYDFTQPCPAQCDPQSPLY